MEDIMENRKPNQVDLKQNTKQPIIKKGEKQLSLEET